jgi:hypothetical protein
LWKNLTVREGIPLVSGTKERNYKKDLQVLYPITLSGKIISQYLGKVVEKIPPITEECFNELQQLDPFEKDKLKAKNYVFIVDPSFVLRTVDQYTPLALDDAGNLVENKQTDALEKKELKIPFSLKNITMLCSYPLKGKENMRVFAYLKDEVFQQCNTRPDKISVYFMRRHVVDQSRGQPYAKQEKLVKDKGFEMLPLRVRVLFNTVVILKDGTCPDVREPRWTYSRHPDTVRSGNNVYHSVVGAFVPRAGVRVNSCDFGSDTVGVVLGKPAEVPVIGT